MCDLSRFYDLEECLVSALGRKQESKVRLFGAGRPFKPIFLRAMHKGEVFRERNVLGISKEPQEKGNSVLRSLIGERIQDSANARISCARFVARSGKVRRYGKGLTPFGLQR